MNCPQCNEEMRKCRIWGYQHTLKWNYEEDGKIMGIWLYNGQEIGQSGMFSRPHVKTHRCEKCKIQILDERENIPG